MGFPGDHHESGGWSAPPPYDPAEHHAYGAGTPYGQGPQTGAPHDQGAHPGTPYGHGQGYQDLSHEHSLYDQGSYDQSPSYGAAGPGPHGSGGRRSGGRRSGSGGRRWVAGAAAAAGVVILGGGVGLVLTSGGGGQAPVTPTPSPTVTTPTVNPTPAPTETGRGQRLDSRTTDPQPLTLNEVFKHHRFKGGGRVYTMTARRSERTCSHGVHGSAFRRLLAHDDCDQVLRATFSNGKLIGTIGVLNLRTHSDARAAQRHSRPKDTFILPLPGSGTTRKIGQGLSLTTAEADGHYLIMSWIQYPSGKKIAQRDYSAVTAFVQYTTLGSNLRPALNYRSMVGKPA